MGFFNKKESAIDRRLRELQREMSRVNTDIKDCARAPKTPDAPAIRRAPEPVATPKAPPAFKQPTRLVPSPSPAPVAEVIPPQDVEALAVGMDEAPAVDPVPADDAGQKVRDDLFAHVTKGPPEDARQPDLFASSRAGASSDPARHASDGQSDRERFASYFMAGHFQNLRPLRHERRMLRNRAIVMLVLVLILAVVVWKLFF